jgi:YcxB-like protein
MAPEATMNRLEFKCTFKEFFEGTRNATRLMRLMPTLGLVFIALVLFVYLAHYLSGDQESDPGFPAPFLIAFLISWLIGVLWVSYPLLQAWLIWRGGPSAKEVIRCWADEEGFSLQTANSDASIKWPGLIEFRETRNLFLIYPSKRMYCLIPKRAFADESQVREFRELLDRKISQRR